VTAGRLLSEQGIAMPTAWLVHSLTERMRGLLGRPPLKQGEAFLIPTQAVHTWGMGYPLDLLYLNREGRVVALVEHLPPGRFAPWRWDAQLVVEMAPGSLDGLQPGLGDRYWFEAAPAIHA
jgi:uncharacterized membrane protein (UPF0127 family)